MSAYCVHQMDLGRLQILFHLLGAAIVHATALTFTVAVPGTITAVGIAIGAAGGACTSNKKADEGHEGC
jgi:hypothetical protein